MYPKIPTDLSAMNKEHLLEQKIVPDSRFCRHPRFRFIVFRLGSGPYRILEMRPTFMSTARGINKHDWEWLIGDTIGMLALFGGKGRARYGPLNVAALGASLGVATMFARSYGTLLLDTTPFPTLLTFISLF